MKKKYTRYTILRKKEDKLLSELSKNPSKEIMNQLKSIQWELSVLETTIN